MLLSYINLMKKWSAGVFAPPWIGLRMLARQYFAFGNLSVIFLASLTLGIQLGQYSTPSKIRCHPSCPCHLCPACPTVLEIPYPLLLSLVGNILTTSAYQAIVQSRTSFAAARGQGGQQGKLHTVIQYSVGEKSLGHLVGACLNPIQFGIWKRLKSLGGGTISHSRLLWRPTAWFFSTLFFEMVT